MTEIIDFGLFPTCVLNYNTLCFEDRFVSIFRLASFKTDLVARWLFTL